MLDGTRRADHLARRARRDHPAPASAPAFPVGVHAIGDQANRDALDAFEATRDEWAPLGLRHRIEHAQILLPGDAERFARSASPSPCQFSHAPSDRDLAERRWAGETHRAYAWRSLLDAGALLVQRLGRADRGARPVGGDRRRRPAHARRPAGVAPRAGGHRRGGARCRRASTRRGSRATSGAAAGCCPGYLADLVVLDRDPFAIEPERAARRCGSSRRWSAAAGCTTRRPGTEGAARRPGADRTRIRRATRLVQRAHRDASSRLCPLDRLRRTHRRGQPGRPRRRRSPRTSARGSTRSAAGDLRRARSSSHERRCLRATTGGSSTGPTSTGTDPDASREYTSTSAHDGPVHERAAARSRPAPRSSAPSGRRCSCTTSRRARAASPSSSTPARGSARARCPSASAGSSTRASSSGGATPSRRRASSTS